jgi:hypothetical protein
LLLPNAPQQEYCCTRHHDGMLHDPQSPLRQPYHCCACSALRYVLILSTCCSTRAYAAALQHHKCNQ